MRTLKRLHAVGSPQTMDPTETDPTPREDGRNREPYTSTPLTDVVEDFLTAKGKGRGNVSGNYRRNAARDVENFITWLDEQPDIDPPATFTDLAVQHFRRYARALLTGEIPGMRTSSPAAGTVTTYYAHVSAFAGWCAREGYLDSNLAQHHHATEALPDDAGQKSGERQSWSATHRELITRHVDDQAAAAVDAVRDDEWTAIRACRDRAFVYLLCYSGIRGAELLADSNDDRRDGVQWADLDLEDAKLTVLSKKQQWDDRSLPAPTHHPLRIYRRVLAPASADWPIFPSLHRPTLYGRARDALAVEHGLAETKLEAILDERPIYDVLRKYNIAPSSILKDGGRRIMKRLCEAAAIELDDRHGYLAPHGGRRGAGEVMVRTHGHAAAARFLDNSERVVRDAYSHIEASELAEQATAAFEAVDARSAGSGDDT